MYVLQMLEKAWGDKYITLEDPRYKTLEEARAALNAKPGKSQYRIAEEYTITKYKAVKTTE